MTALDTDAALSDMRHAALYIDADGDVTGIRDAALANQVWEIERGLGVPWLRYDGQWSAWLWEPEFILSLTRPDTWEACCRLYGIDCADRALDLYGGVIDPRSRQAVRIARLHAHGQATDEDLEAAHEAARPPTVKSVQFFAAADAVAEAAAEAAAWSAAEAAWSASDAAAEAAADAAGVDRDTERRAQWQRLLQYVDHGIEAEHMPWPEETP